jgi:hypothetical protein
MTIFNARKVHFAPGKRALGKTWGAWPPPAPPGSYAPVSKSLMFSFCSFFFDFGIPISFSRFSSAIVRAFAQNLSGQKQIQRRRKAKPVNFTVFTGRTIAGFVPLVYSFLLSEKFCILKAL